jgi:periplasmic protein CpxP/Spy
MRKFLNKQAATMLMLSLLLLAATSSRALAQNAGEGAQAEVGQNERDGNWATALNLTPDQVAQIRAIRQQNRADWQAARQRVRQAQRALDQSIYSDDASEAVIEERAREVAEAQAAEVRLRAMTELSIRRVLTPEQLQTFRTIRQERVRAAEMNRRGARLRRLGDRQLENGTKLPPARERLRGRSLLLPRQRRNRLPQTIRP